MRTLLLSRAIVFAFLHTSKSFVAGQDVPSQSLPPFPIPANSSSVVPQEPGTGVFSSSFSSTTSIGTAPIEISSTRVKESPTSATDIAPPETSTDSLSSVITSLTPTDSPTISDSSSASGSPMTSGTTSRGDTTSSISDTVTITNGPSSTDSFILPPRPPDTSSSTEAIILPSGITLPPDPGTTLLPTGTEIRSSASDMSQIIAGIFPLLNGWMDDPQPPRVTSVTNELNKILPKASDFLNKLPKPTDGVEPCKSGKRRRAEEEYQGLHTFGKRSFLGGLFKTAFSLVTCVIDTTNRVKDGVIKGTTDAVKALENDLVPMLDALNEVDPNESDPSASNSDQPSSTQSESSSSSSCTLNTVSNCNIACTAIATTTAGRARRETDGEACTTACDAPITKCGATGITSASTMTSTTTVVQLCAKDCSRCNAPIPRPEPITGGDYLTGTNGLAYVPAPTVSALSTYPDIAARNIAPLETGTPSHKLYKRTLTNPRDAPYDGDVEKWLVETVKQPGSKNLDHARGNDPARPEWFSTSITDQLLDARGSWNLGNMHGCTAVVVVSRKRMFMAHIWEDPTMNNKNNNFQRDALDALRNPDGDGKGVTQGLGAFTSKGGDFENVAENHVQAMVITPYNRESSDPQPNDLQFPDQVDQIKAMLNTVLGLTPTLIPYEDRGEDPEWEFGHGKLLIQYDPAQAMQQEEGQNCPTQAAALEVWFEELNHRPRYGDTWQALSTQLVPAQPGPSRRFIRGQQVTDADQEEWQEYASVLKRQNGVCARQSGTLSASSTAQDPTTLRTSFTTTSGGGGSTGTTPSTGGEPVPNTTTDQPPATTEEPRTSANVPEPDPTSSPPPKSKALSVVLWAFTDSNEHYNSWIFFETKVGLQADICNDDAALEDQNSRWTDDNAIIEPPWPHGTFTMTLYGEDNCQYLNDGNGAGILHCPSFGEGNNVSCQEDKEKGQQSAITQCVYAPPLTKTAHRATYCEW